MQREVWRKFNTYGIYLLSIWAVSGIWLSISQLV